MDFRQNQENGNISVFVGCLDQFDIIKVIAATFW